MFKLKMVTLSEAVQLGGDLRKTWMADRDECTMWLEGSVVHIERRGQHFCSPMFVGAWGDIEQAKGRKVKGDKLVEPAA